jgi:hypothetical protein
MRNVAIFGNMYSGKTTLAELLLRTYHWNVIVRNADGIKALAADVYNNGLPVDKSVGYTVRNPVSGQDEFISGRQLLQRLGSSVKTFDQHFWLRYFKARTRGKHSLICDDGRFPFEFEMFKNSGWFTIKVQTPIAVRVERAIMLNGQPPTQDELNHDSETALWDIPDEEYDLIINGANQFGPQTVQRIMEAIQDD